MSLIQKLNNERKELSQRIEKLKIYLGSSNFKTLDLNQQNLLRIKDIERRNINGPTKQI